MQGDIVIQLRRIADALEKNSIDCTDKKINKEDGEYKMLKVKCKVCGKEAIFPEDFNTSFYGWIRIKRKDNEYYLCPDCDIPKED